MTSPVSGEVDPTWLLVAIVTGSDSRYVCVSGGSCANSARCTCTLQCCLLPDRPQVVSTVQALARRVRDGGGRARVLKTVLVDADDHARIIAEQSADRDDEYREVVQRTGEFLSEIDRETQRNRATYTEVEESEADLERFDRWLTSIAARDYFHAPGRRHAEAALQQCRDALAAFEAAAVAADTETTLGGTSLPHAESPARLRVIPSNADQPSAQ